MKTQRRRGKFIFVSDTIIFSCRIKSSHKSPHTAAFQKTKPPDHSPFATNRNLSNLAHMRNYNAHSSLSDRASRAVFMSEERPSQHILETLLGPDAVVPSYNSAISGSRITGDCPYFAQSSNIAYSSHQPSSISNDNTARNAPSSFTFTFTMSAVSAVSAHRFCCLRVAGTGWCRGHRKNLNDEFFKIVRNVCI